MPYLSCKQTAQILKVSQSTIKRLCDDGVLASVRTPGGHRRISLKSVRAWQASAGQQSSEAEVIGHRRYKLWLASYEDFIKLLLNDQRSDLDESVVRIRKRYTIAELCDNTLAPALVKLGWLHGRGVIEAYQLKVACQRVRSLLFRMSDCLNLPARPLRAVGAAVVGDPADLGSLFAEVCLREVGWDAESLGEDVPGDSLAKAAQAREAALVWVAYTHQQPRDVLIEHNRQLNAGLPSQTRLAIGGGALTPELRRSLQFHFFGDSLVHLVSYAQSQIDRSQAA